MGPHPLSLEMHLPRRFRLEPAALCARLGPLPLATALSGVAWQSQLAAPAKFALARSGEAELQAEIPLVAERHTCEKLADAALDEAILWPEVRGEAHDCEGPAFPDEEIGSALSRLSWGVRQTDAGSYQIDAAPAPGHAMRVTLAVQGAALRASTATSLRVSSPQARRALAYFALESNSRLRLARISVAQSSEGADIVWDAVLPATLGAAGAPRIVEAVVYAQLLTRRSLGILADPQLADAYLRQREPRSIPVTPAPSPARQSVGVEQSQ